MGNGWWSGLLFDPGNDGVSGTSTVVFGGFSVPEEFQSGITTDFEFLSQLGFFSSINLGQLDRRVLFGQHSGSLSVFRSQRFAMSAPRSVKFNQNEFIVSDGGFEVLFSENQDSFFFGDLVGNGQGDHAHNYGGEKSHTNQIVNIRFFFFLVACSAMKSQNLFLF